MAELEQPIESADSTATQGEPERRGRRLPMRRGQRDEEPLVVEMAWLVIEAATAFYRVRRILARL